MMVCRYSSAGKDRCRSLMGQSYWYRSRLADSSTQSHPGGELLRNSVDLVGYMSKTPRYGDSQRFLAVVGSENSLR